MSLSVWQRNIVTESGDVIPDAEIEVFDAGSSSKPDLFSDPDGNSSITNPFNADSNGFARFYVAGGRYDIAVNGAVLWEDVALGTAQRRDTGSAPSEVPTNDDANERGFAQQVNSVSDLRASTFPASLQRLWLSGYYGVGTAGGGPLYRDDESTEDDDGGLVFVDSDGVRWKRARTNTVSFFDFGAMGDGASDDTESVQQAVASDAHIVSGLGGLFLVTETIDVPPGKVLDGGEFIFDHADPEAEISVFDTQESVEKSVSLAESAERGDSTITLSQDVPEGAKYAIIRSDAIWADDGADQVKKGEFLLVSPQSTGTTLVLDVACDDDYLTADNASVEFLTDSESSEFKSLAIRSTDESGSNNWTAVRLEKVSGVSIDKCRISNIGRQGIAIVDSFDVALIRNTIKNTSRDGTGYGYATYSACRKITVHKNVIAKPRVSGISGGTDGVLRELYITNNSTYDSNASSFNVKASARSVIVKGNVCVGNPSTTLTGDGLRLRGSDIVVSGNKLSQFGRSPISCVMYGDTSGVGGIKCVVAGNIVEQSDDIAVRVEGGGDGDVESIAVTGNVVSFVENTSSSKGGVHIRAQDGVVVKAAVITSNTVTNCPYNCIDVRGVGEDGVVDYLLASHNILERSENGAAAGRGYVTESQVGTSIVDRNIEADA